jgi:uncharacterized protein with NAD-binding domain and iron-sulfur cluster
MEKRIYIEPIYRTHTYKRIYIEPIYRTHTYNLKIVSGQSRTKKGAIDSSQNPIKPRYILFDVKFLQKCPRILKNGLRPFSSKTLVNNRENTVCGPPQAHLPQAQLDA